MEITAREMDLLIASGSKFLRAISVKPGIMELMIGLGYSEIEHREGWDRYLKMLGYMGAAKTPVTTIKSTSQAQALNEVDHYDEPAFRRANVALGRLHPDQQTYIFGDGLAPKTGTEAMGSVKTFLDRYAALRDGTDPARANQREADKSAAATLEARNIVNPTIEKRLRDLIEVVKTASATRPNGPAAVSEESLQAAAKAFDEWLNDWRTTTSAGIVRRDLRIMLGISRRRATEATPEDAPEPPVVQPPATQPPVVSPMQPSAIH